jgi:polysaccharide export outer membrane protein
LRPVGDNQRGNDGRGADKRSRKGMRSLATAAALVVAAVSAGGCDIKSFIDPSEMFYNTNKPIQNPILDSISDIYPSVDDPNVQFLNAGDIRPEDLVVISTDYKIGRGDLISISVQALVSAGVETNKQGRVSETGNITMPLIPPVHAEGLTEAELQKAISDAYADAKIINQAQVTVQVIEERSRTFSAIGSVGNAGEYQILKSDFKMLDAMVLFRDFPQTTTEVYVVRQISEDPSSQKPGTEKPTPTGNPAVPPVNPTHPGASPYDRDRTDATPVRPAALAVAAVKEAGKGSATIPGGVPLMQASGGLAFNPPSGSGATRVIRVPVGPLRNGDFRYNIVIRPHDLIIAPLPVVGEYYAEGHIARTGVYSLADRKITIKQAVWAAGGLDGVAIPERTELTRRVGPNREVSVRLDLDAIFSGTQPDIYLKPYDEIQVGTNILAPFIADIREGFRITYGFGFLYDRNYAPQSNAGG